MPKRAVVYVRLSDFRGDADPTLSPETQEEKCRAYCTAKGWDVVEVVRDLDVSGSDKGLRLDRPGLSRVRALLPSVDVVVFAKLDRLARNVIDFRTFAEEAEEQGATLASVAESLDLSTAAGRFVATILAAFAEMEAAAIADRVRDSRAAKAQALRWGGAPPPYGYESVPHPEGKGRGLALKADEVAVIHEMADRVLAGEALTSIALDFNRRGVARRRGTWAASTVARILRNDATVGRLTHRGAPVLGDDGLPATPWPAALPPTTWRTVGAVLDANAERIAGSRRPARKRASRLLSGYLYCETCNRPLALQTYKAGPTYVCKAKANAKPCATGGSVLAERVEEEVVGQFLRAVGGLPATRVVAAVDAQAVDRLAAANAALDDLARRLRDADDDETLTLLARRATLRALVDDLGEAAATPRVQEEPTGRTVGEEWEAADVLARRALLGRALDHVVVRPIGRGHHRRPVADRLVVVWHPDEPTVEDAGGESLNVPEYVLAASGALVE